MDSQAPKAPGLSGTCYTFDALLVQFLAWKAGPRHEQGIKGRKNFERKRQELQTYSNVYTGGCQNYGPFLGTLNEVHVVLRTPKGTVILITIHIQGLHTMVQNPEPLP